MKDFCFSRLGESLSTSRLICCCPWLSDETTNRKQFLKQFSI